MISVRVEVPCQCELTILREESSKGSAGPSSGKQKASPHPHMTGDPSLIHRYPSLLQVSTPHTGTICESNKVGWADEQD
jgi:hypothetical protein